MRILLRSFLLASISAAIFLILIFSGSYVVNGYYISFYDWEMHNRMFVVLMTYLFMFAGFIIGTLIDD